MKKNKTYNRLAGRVCLFFFLILLVLAPVHTFSQTPNPSPTNQESNAESKFICGHTYPEIVIVQVEVTNKYRKPVSNLSHEDFVVYEEGNSQAIAFFQEEKKSFKKEARTIYRIGYHSENLRLDGKYRKIRIEIREGGKRKLKVRYSPNGYFAKPIDSR